MSDTFRRMKNDHGPVSAGELAAAVVYYEPIETSNSLDDRYAEYYCTIEECCVREVRIITKERVISGLPTCPACDHPLKFHHYLKPVTLLPDDLPTTPGFGEEELITLEMARDFTRMAARMLREEDGGFLPPREAAASLLEVLWRRLGDLELAWGRQCPLGELHR